MLVRNALANPPLLDSLLLEVPHVDEEEKRSKLFKKIGDLYFRIHADSTIRYYQYSLESALLSDTHQDDLIILRSFAHLYGNRKNDYLTAVQYLQQAIEIALAAKDSVNLAIVKNDFGVMAKKEGDFQKAINYFFEAYELIKNQKDDHARMRILLSLGVIHNETAYHEKAKEYYREALVLADQNRQLKMKGVLLNNLSKTCRDQAAYEESAQYLDAALVIFDSLNNDYWKGLVYYNVGYNFFLQEQYTSAIEHFELALELNHSSGDKDRKIMVLTSLAEAYLVQQQYGKAIENANEALQLLKEIETTEYYPTLYSILGQSHRQRNDFKLSAYYLQQHIVAKQKKDEQGLSSKIGQMQAMYENELKSAAVKQLELKVLADDIKQQKTSLAFRLLVISFITVISLLGLLFYKTKLQQSEKNYQLRNQLARDLHDNIGSSLNHIKIMLGRFTRQVSGHQPELKTIYHLSDGVISNMYDLIWSLDKEKERIEDLTDYMRDHASNVLSPIGIPLSIKVNNHEKNRSISPELKNNIYSIYKEAINNIVKHTKPQEIAIRITVSNNVLNVFIENDKQELIEKKMSSKLGLLNMRKRASLIRGHLNIQDEKDKFIVDLTVKLLA